MKISPHDGLAVNIARATLGLSNRELADLLEISPVYLSRTATGHHKLSRKTAKRLQSIISDFIKEHEDNPRQPAWFEAQLEALEEMARHLGGVKRTQGRRR